MRLTDDESKAAHNVGFFKIQPDSYQISVKGRLHIELLYGEI